MYDDARYAHSRLSGTIVRINDDPITIDFCEPTEGNKIYVGYTRIINNSGGSSTLDKINLIPVPLGFASTKVGVSYLARVPKRSDYRQGLRISNYISLFGPGHRLVNNTSLYKTITNQFMSFDCTLDEVTNIGISTPFSREFALISNGDTVDILYKWYGRVGDVVHGIPALSGDFNYLQESLEEAISG